MGEHSSFVFTLGVRQLSKVVDNGQYLSVPPQYRLLRSSTSYTLDVYVLYIYHDEDVQNCMRYCNIKPLDDIVPIPYKTNFG